MSDDTCIMMEEEVKRLTSELSSLEPGSTEYKNILDDLAVLTDKIITLAKDNFDCYDKQERRRIEEEKIAVERHKQELTWSRVLFELGKAVIPLGMSFIGYDVFQKRILKFEETGRITSTAGRELHLPRFIK